MNETYQSVVFNALANLYSKILSFLPNILAAVIVVILGWLVGIFLSQIVAKILQRAKVDSLADQLGLKNLARQTGYNLSLSGFFAWLIKWFFFLGSFIAAADILNLTEVSRFFYQDVLTYAGHVIVAMAIILLGMLAAKFFSGLVEVSVKASGVHSTNVLSSLTKWAIVTFAVVAGLSELLPTAGEFLQDLFKAVIAMFAIAGGIAFGLGGREHAAKILDKIEENLNKKI